MGIDQCYNIERWNNITLPRYLQITYELFHSNVELPKSLIIIKICFGHFSHTVARTIDKLYSSRTKEEGYKQFKEVLRNCITLLCVVRDINHIDELFNHICVIFLNESAEKANDSIRILTGLTNKNASKLELDNEEAEDGEESDDEFEVTISESVKSDTIYRNSPWLHSKYKQRLTIKLI